MKIIGELLIVITTWMVGAILLFKIVVTGAGFLVIVYQMRGQVIESGGWKNYLNKFIGKWKK